MQKEATIVINGVQLNYAQSMAFRVAVGSFIDSLTPGSLGDDEHGEAMVRLYRERCHEIQSLLTST